MAVGTTYRVLRQAAYAEVQRLWGEWRGRGGGRPRRPAARGTAPKATVEALEPRQMLSVTASVSGASHVTAGYSYALNLSASATGGTLTGWSISWGDGFCDTAASNASAAYHTYASAYNSRAVTATAADNEAGVSHYCTAFTSVVVDASGGSCGAGISGGTATEGACSPYTLYPSFCDPSGQHASTWVAYWGDNSPSGTYCGTQSAITHAYGEPGNYSVTLVAYDADYCGGPVCSAGSYSSFTTVAVYEATPYLGATGSGSVSEGSLYTVYDSFCDPGNDTLSSWAVWWGDGASTTNISGSVGSAAHSYSEPGSYCVSLVAFDEDHSSGLSTWAAPCGYGTSLAVNVCEAAAMVQVGGGAATVTEGSVYTLHPTFSDPGADAVSNWLVNWGDGSSGYYAGTLTALGHSYANEPGGYTVTVQGFDEDQPSTGTWGASAYTSSVRLTVAEAPQAAWINASSAILPNCAIAYTFGVSDPGGDLPTGWTINWGDGGNLDHPAGGTGSTTVTHSYTANGTYTITATAADEDSAAIVSTAVVTVSDQPTPWACGNDTSVEGSVYTLNAGFNDVAGDVATKWVVDWRDGHVDTYTNASGGPFSHTYDEPSSYGVLATAYDADGSSTVCTTVTVIEGTALASAWGSASVTESGTSNFTLSFSFTDPGDALTGWSVDWGDGHVTPGVPGQTTAAHAYSEPGVFTPTFMAFDEDHPAALNGAGDTNYTASTVVTVNEATGAAAYALGSATAVEGSAYNLTLNFSDPGGDPVTQWRVDWGDGGSVQTFTALTTNTFSHVYHDAASNYTITATAVSEDASTSATQAVAVGGVPPLLQIGGSTTVQQGADYALALWAQYPPNDPDGETPSSLTWTVNWGDGPDLAHPDTSTDPGVAALAGPLHHVYSQAGHYVVTATASDDDGTWGPVLLNGQLDVGFGSGGIVTTDFNTPGQHDEGRSIALQPSGGGGFKIVAAGVTYPGGGDPQLVLARYASDGTLDTGFGDAAPAAAAQPRTGEVLTTIDASGGSAMLVQPDGSILVAGASGTGLFTLARYSPDGTHLDTTFGPGHTGVLTTPLAGSNFGTVALAIQSLPGGDRLIVAQSVGGVFTLSRYDMNGTYDTSFGTVTTNVGSSGVSGALAIDADFNILVAGQINGQFAVSRFLPGGTLDTSFNTTGQATTSLGSGSMVGGVSIALQGDGKIVLAGTDYAPNALDFALVRYNPDGTLDTSAFGTNGTGGVTITPFPQGVGAYALALALGSDADGNTTRIVVAGTAGGAVALAGYTPDGQLDRAFGIAGTLQTPLGTGASRAAALLVQSDGKILLAGTANDSVAVLDITDLELARYERDNTLTVTPLAGDLAASATPGEVDLAWTDNTAPGTQVAVERSSDGTNFPDSFTVSAAAGTFRDQSVSPLGHYWYRLRAVVAGTGQTVYSNVVDVYLPAASGSVTIDGPGAGKAGIELLFGLNPQSQTGINQWTVNWGDGSAPQNVASNGSLTSVPHTFALAGNYLLSATASGGGHTYTAQLPFAAVTGDPAAAPTNIAINFEPATRDIPTGSLEDVGHAFASQGDYFSYDRNYVYGWDLDMNANTVERNSSLSLDKRHDTFIAMQPGHENHSWSIALPDGTYHVHLVAGDPVATNSNYQILANGVTVVSGVPTAAHPWVEGRASVLVTGGRLTVTNGPGAVNNKIDYIEITPAQAAAAAPAAPSGLTAVAASPTAVDLHWSDNSDGESGFRIERSVNGGHWTQVGTTGPNAQSYTDTGLTPNTPYAYRVWALNDTAPAGMLQSGSPASVTTPTSAAEAPYGGTAPKITDRIEAENFDTGGEGVAYHDDNADNIGGQYRKTGVDIGPADYLTPGGYMVGWTHTGEWMNYTVKIAQAGNYRLDFRLASSGPGGQFSVRVDGVAVTGPIAIPDTGGWGSYVTLSQENVALPAGRHVLQLYMQRVGVDGGVANCDWFQAALMPPAPAAPIAPAAPEALTAAPATESAGGVLLTWQPPPALSLGGSSVASTATGYVIERSDNGGPFTPLNPAPSLPVGTTSYTDTSAPAGQTCVYVVTSFNNASPSLLSAPSNLATVRVPGAGALVVNPTADASARQGSSKVNYGATTPLYARGLSAGADSQVYLTFDAAGAPTPIGRVVLRLFGRLDGSNQTGVTVDVKGVTDTGWGEGTLTWDNRNTAGVGPTLATATVYEGMGRWYEWDVTSFVQQQLQQQGMSPPHPVSLMLVPTVATGANVVFNSKEAAADKPALVISPAVAYPAPTIDPVPMQTWAPGTTHTVVTHFHDPDPNAVDTVSVDWGDGTITPATVNGSEISAAHSYTGSDPYHTATITLTNTHDGQTASAIFNVHVTDQVGAISGLVWNDHNQSGAQDTAFNGQPEPGMSGWTVYADLNGDGRYEPGADVSTVTAADGNYTLGGLPAGAYTLRLDAPPGYAVTTPVGGAYDVTVTDNHTTDGMNFGVFTNHAPQFDNSTPPPAQINPFGDTPSYAPATLWSPGDVFQSDYADNKLVEYGADGTLKRIWDLNPYNRQLVDYTTSPPTQTPLPPISTEGGFGGMAFAKDGTLVLTGFSARNVIKLDPMGHYAGTVNTGAQAGDPEQFIVPEFVVFDALGNMYVGNTGKVRYDADPPEPPQQNGIFKFDPQGQLVDIYAQGQQIDWGDLGTDQHTLLFTFEGSDGAAGQGQAEIFSLNTDTGAYFKTLPQATISVDNVGPLAVHVLDGTDGAGMPAQFELNSAYALRILPGGDVLLAGAIQQIDPGASPQTYGEKQGVFRIHGLLSEGATPTGSDPRPTITQTYATTISKVNTWFALNLDPDGKSLWTAGLGGNNHGMFKFDIATGALLQVIETRNALDPAVGLKYGSSSSITVYGEQTAAISVNQPYTYQVHATDPEHDLVSYRFDGDSHGARLDPSSGVMTWSPTATGTFSFTVIASDDHGAQTPKTFFVSVSFDANRTDQPPVLPATTLSPATTRRWYTGRVAASDPDGDRLIYSLVDSPDFTIDPASGEFQWLPTAQDQADGSKAVTVRVTDSRGASDQKTFVIKVLSPQNLTDDPPAFASNLTVPAATVGQAFTFPLIINDHSTDGGPYEFVPVSVPEGMTVSSSTGVVQWTPGAGQAGVQSFTVGVFDLDDDSGSGYRRLIRGAYAQATFTVDVRGGPLGVHFTQVSPTSWQLDAVPGDSTVPGPSTYVWYVPSAAGIQDLTLNRSSVLVTFSQAGSYECTVTATNSAGTSSAQKTLDVGQQPTRIAARVPALVVAPGQVLGSTYLAATVYDQFGMPMSDLSAALVWSLNSGAIGGLSNGTYTAGTLPTGVTSATDVLQVTLTQGVTVIYDDMRVTITTQDALVGRALTGQAVSENQPAALGLAYFYDSAAGASASDYTVNIDWGDGTAPSAGAAVTVTAPDSSFPHLFLVSAAHTYPQDRTYPFTVQVTAPGSRLLTITPDDAGMVVQDARLTISPQPVTARVWLQTPPTTVATFTDASPNSSLSEFKALIDWGDGSDPEVGTVTPVPDAPGHYEVQGSHLFSRLGTPALAKIQILEVDDGGSQLRASSPLHITVGESALPAVTGVTAVGVAPTLGNHPQIALWWDFLKGFAGGYIVKRFNPDGTVITLPTPDDPGTQKLVTNVPWADTTNLQFDTRYGYQVLTTDLYGNQSDPSPIVYATTWSDSTMVATFTPPSPFLESGTHVHLTWSSPVTGLVWDVLRAKDQGHNTPPDPQFFASVLGSAPPVAGTDFIDMTASANTEYWYEVVAVEPFGKRGRPAAAVSITTGQPGGATQIAPTNLTAGYAGSFSGTRRIGLEWDAAAGDALLGYDVYRGTTADFTLDATSLIGTSADARYTDDLTAAVPGTEFYYAVKAVSVGSDGGEISSPVSNVAHVSTAAVPSAPPAAPDGLGAEASVGGLITVTLSWKEPRLADSSTATPPIVNREMGFEIRRRPDDGPDPSQWTVLGLATQDATSFVDTTAFAATAYDYQVASYDVGTLTPGAAQSQLYGPSAWFQFTTPMTGPAPSAPGNLAVDAAHTTYSQIALTWDAAPGTTSATVAYYVYRSTGAGDFIRLTAAPLSSPGYVDAAVQQGVTYAYRVTAVSDQNSQSIPVELDGVTAPTAPALRPAVTITSPAPFNGINVNFATGIQSDGRLRVLTPVRAFIDDPNGDLVSWSLVLRPANVANGVSADDIPLAAGTSNRGTDRNADGTLKEPNGALLYTLDPTLFPSGDYQLVLTASDGTGPGDPSIVPVSLYSQAKLGNLTLPVTDLSLDVPGGPITVSRVYDSQNADVLGDFGYGWKLEVSDTSLRTTATAGTGDRGSGNTLRPGDQVYLTLPGGQQHAFQFWPVPSNYSPGTLGGADPYGPGYVTYWAQFLCVDGSNATLSVQGDLHEPNIGDRVSLEYDKVNNEFHAVAGGQDLSYDPARPQFGRYYEVRTQGGAVYHLDALAGNLLWSQDPSGNQITYGQNTVAGGQYHLVIDRNPDGTVSAISVRDATSQIGNSITYTYAGANPLLTSVTGRDGLTTTYAYGTGAQAHYLTQVTDPRGLHTLTAVYEPLLNRLSSLTDAKGNSVPVSPPASDGSRGSQGVTDPLNNKTEAVYDDHGDVVRQIAAVKDSLGNLTGYSVTVHAYGYFTGDLSSELTDVFSVDGSQTNESSQNALVWEKSYAPFVVQGTDADGLRYTQAPATLLSETDYNLNPGGDNAGLHLPAQQTDYLPNGDTRVTAFTSYTALGMPQNVTVTLHHGGTTVPLSTTTSEYDAAGNLRYSFNAAGEGTEYVYSTGTDADPLTADDGQPTDNPPPAHLPKGLLLATYRVTGEATLADTDPTTNPTRIGAGPLSVNTYYRSSTRLYAADGTSSPVPPSFVGKLRSSIDASGQETRYLYDANGDVTYQLTAKAWTDGAGNQTTGWVGTRTVYDSSFRPYQTWQIAVVGAALHVGSAGGVENPAFAGYPLKTGQTTYDAAGQVTTTADVYGNQTAYTYDADKSVVRTVYDANQDAVSTETRTVYDALGRVSWQTDRFLVGTANPVFATHTVYDALGRVVATERYQGTQIAVTTQDLSAAGGTVTVGASTLVSAGTLISSSRTLYDDAGRVAESTDAAGLRTGTVYYSDGRVQFSGVLKTTAVDTGGNPWWAGTDTHATDPHPDPHLFPDQYFSSHSQSLYDQVDASTGKPYSGLVYDRVIDPDGHKTDSYKDLLGRSVFTVYDDGSFTQTLYGVGKSPVPGHEPTPANGVPDVSGQPGQVIDGYQVTKIDAMGQATDSFYDHAGHLTDVWLPAVADAKQPDPVHPGQFLSARPHWHYAYDASGNEIAQTDPDNHTTTFAYDEQGHQVVKTLQDVATVAQDGQTTRSFYDAHGRLLAVKLYDSADSAAVAVKTTTYDFSYYHPGQVSAEYRYGGDQSIGVYLASAEHTTYVYDDDPSLPGAERLAQGRVAKVEEYAADSAPAVETHTLYDPVTGQPSSITSPEGTINHVYDPATGRLTETWTGTSHDAAVTDTLYGYDIQGRLASVSVAKQNGQTPSLSWSGSRFDAVGNAIATTLPTTRYSYDAAGNVTQVLYPNGTETDTDLTNLWNPTNPQEVVTNKRGSTTLSSFTYTFNAERQKISSAETVYDVGEATFSNTLITWQYDAENRLTKEIYDYGSDDSTTTNTGHTADDYTAGYVYDLAGNRKVQTQDKGNDGTIDQTTTFTYDNEDELKDQLVKDAGGVTVSNTISTYVNGSLQSEAVTTGSGTTTNTYGYDLRERMISATVNGQSFTYTYDSDGNRVSETTAPGTSQASTTTYVQDTVNPTGYSQVLEQRQGGTAPTVSYVLGASVIAQNANGTNSYLMPDGHGSTRQLTAYTSSSGTNGHITGRYDYDAFGTDITFTVSSHPANVANTVIKYTGQLWDASVGMYDLRARDYRPDLGRFSTSDNITTTPGDLENANLYLYVANDPLNAMDPSGHDGELGSQLTTIGTIARIGTGIGFGVAGAWNLANAGIDVQRAYAASIGDSPNATLEIVGWVALSMLQTYTGIANIQTANALLFGAPTSPIPPNGMAILRAAFTAAGDNPVAMGATVYALSPAVAGAIVNVAGALVATNSFLNSDFFKLSNQDKAELGEKMGWDEARDRGEITIQAPGRWNEGGPDYITMKMNPDGTATVRVYDAKWGPRPKTLSPAKLQEWMPEVEQAVNEMRDGTLKSLAKDALNKGRVEGLIYNAH